MLHENEWHREERSMEQHGTLPSFPTDVSMDLSKWHLPPKMACWCDVSTNIVHHCSLPETSSLPCAKIRAHGKPSLFRVPTERAHDKHLAHGKHFLCRVSGQKTHGKHPTHGKGSHLPCAAEESTRQRSLVCRAPRLLHTAKLWHTAKLCKKK